MWQSWHFSCFALAGFSGFEAWWQVSHLASPPAAFTCAAWSNFTPPIGAPFRMITPGAFPCADITVGPAMSASGEEGEGNVE